MSSVALHPLAAGYLDQLERAAADVPQPRRDELLADIEAHLREAIAPGATDVEVLNILDNLGDPDQIVAAELDADAADQASVSGPHEARSRRGFMEWAAIFLILIGGLILPFFGWAIGVVLLWVSKAWTVRDKLIGTFILPGGLLAPGLLGLIALSLSSSSVTVCTTSSTSSGGSSNHVHTVSNCSGGNGGGDTIVTILFFAVFAASIILPIVTAIYLALRAGRPVGEA